MAIVSKRADKWRAMFLAIDGPQRYLVQDMPDAASELIVWDVPEAPPANLRAPVVDRRQRRVPRTEKRPRR
ncbi:hypothetical protein LP420_17425 [Massilia sp. B-10]|nr:hypothetical protein LP420_17425 [Massilia sp. B-10]